jgi:mono/diheme cytochrome c family protein
MKRALAIAAAACAALASGRAQEPARVDFVREVQPIFRQHCYGCHGPTMHQAGLRLDRRADAMRGGTIAVIGPGTSQGSRLYLRVAGQRGARMPPTASLSDAQITTIKNWIDQGAVWPDEAAGDAPPRPTPALMRAVLDHDLAAARRLLDAGANVNERNASGATALMWAVDDEPATRLLLERGADVNAASDDGRTPLMIASGLHGNAAIVRLLLERHASVAAEANSATPLIDAAYTGDEANLRLLLAAGAATDKLGGVAVALALQRNCRACADAVAGTLTPAMLESGAFLLLPPGTGEQQVGYLLEHGVERAAIDRVHARTVEELSTGAGADLAVPAASPADSPRAAVVRSLPLLQRNDVSFMKKSGCVSCHHNSVAAMAVAEARGRGIAVDEAIARSQTRAIGEYIASWRERMLVGLGIPGDHDSISYILLGLAAGKYPRDQNTDAMARFLWRMQDANGQWHIIAQRPPIESNDIEVTAACMRALQLYAPARGGARYAAAIDGAARWLAAAQPTTTEERAFQILGLRWSGAAAPASAVAASRLAAEQRSDGGWSQLPSLGSDAYATGEALVALADSGMAASDAVYARGVQFLLRTQLADGSWFVRSRAVPVQPFFESGFPHGRSQFISAAATAWAVNALARAAR